MLAESITMVGVQFPLGRLRSRRTGYDAAELRPMRWLPTTAVVLLAVVGGGIGALWLLNTWAVRHVGGMDAHDAANLRLDAIKTALTVAAGLGAGVTLLVALRKQSITERGQRFAEEDSREQRITVLYVAAVDQLGNDKAAVRLGGLYALERLGQDNPKLRQTVVDVICAYLRMPYTPPEEVLRRNATHSPLHITADAPTPQPEQQAERREELQVRLTAQRLLRDHFSQTFHEPEAPQSYWRNRHGVPTTIDLAGATLVDLDLRVCELVSTNLRNAQFHGEADLGMAQFHGYTDLDGAQFHGGANLFWAEFHGEADLDGAQFHGRANLNRVQFHGYADLDRAQFHGEANLNSVRFHRAVGPEEAARSAGTGLPSG
jgi:hypothetical protein